MTMATNADISGGLQFAFFLRVGQSTEGNNYRDVTNVATSLY